HPMTFAMVGMAGFFTAAAKTPISTVIMVSELTGNYELLLPSMWVCAFAFLLTHGRTIYRSQIPSRALTLPHLGAVSTEKIDALAVAEVFHRTRRFVRISRHHTLHEIMALTENSRQRIFPVVDDAGVLLGSFRIGQFFHAVQEDDPSTQTADDLLDDRAFFIYENDSIGHALKILRNNDLEEILVVPADGSRQVLGILTTADILLAYHRNITPKPAQPTGPAAPPANPDDRDTSAPS
ncbi:MAG TPA: CBS domain-containing protein, partial [bacterium]|nr:CBS domain-containing protein [bacterium]